MLCSISSVSCWEIINAVKQLIEKYKEGGVVLSACKYPSKVNFLEATLDHSRLLIGVQYCIKLQIIYLKHTIKRCTEEEA